MKISICTIAFSAVMLFGCDSEFLEAEYIDTPVVEAYLFVGSPVSAKVSRLTAYSNDASQSADDISNLNVTIQYGTETIMLTPLDSGKYAGPEEFIIGDGIQYTLKFIYNSREVSATTIPLSKPKDYTQSATSIVVEAFTGPPTSGSFPEPIELTWSNPENDYYMVLVENIETDPDPINESGSLGPGRPGSFRNEPQQTNLAQIRPQQFGYYGRHRLILLHITPEYASLYKDSGTTSQNIATPPTNVENGLGIFTAINSDTLYLEVKPD